MGFSGSANYTQPGFSPNKQINQLTQDNPVQIVDFYTEIKKRSIPISRFDFDLEKLPVTHLVDRTGSVMPGAIAWEVIDKRVTISFLARDGSKPIRSGLNWGQRPEQNREPNQAYLSLKKESRDEGFLPPNGETFTLITDDGVAMDCVIAQQGRKGIQTTNDNSELGRYFRKRIGVPLGTMVTREALEAYGRTDYTIEKINEETFYLDFSVTQ